MVMLDPSLVAELEAEFASLDANGDGVLSFAEFKAILGIQSTPEGLQLTQWVAPVHACVHACVLACMHACMHACVRAHGTHWLAAGIVPFTLWHAAARTAGAAGWVMPGGPACSIMRQRSSAGAA